VDCRSGKIIGMEALVRWHHPEMGMVSPVQFIPIAEANGFIIELGDWVLREACRTTRKLHDEGHSDLKVAVNVSARQFAEQGFVDRVKSALTDTGLPARFLELELTESLIMENPNRVEGVMSELKALGITFSIDDFGTGYSSLSHLTRFPLDKLKIDRSFILDITERRRRSVITEAIIGLARNLHLQVIAEGVESQVQQQFLSENGCHFIQGFLFSRPLSAPQIQELLARYPYEHFPGTPAGSA
jgi:EAL domain-containing protein (putative c-di-GMP-specific phosphodiesterase class I)